MVDLDKISLGRGERTRTFDLTVPNRARYQLRHTPMVYYTMVVYSISGKITSGIVGET